jgi:gliding motility-associated-like protein
MNIKIYLLIAFSVIGLKLYSQISAPNSTSFFQTSYSSDFVQTGGSNDYVYIFCGNQNNTHVGELVLTAPGCDIEWYVYDGLSFVPLNVNGSVASNLESGLYMARKNCSGTTTCYRAWVWVNRRFVDVAAIPPGCQTFTLGGTYDLIDTEYEIIDPPGSNFIIDENTFIKVCFWANHTYVSDLGFYLKSPGSQTANPGENGVVELCPAASDWGPSSAQGSWTGIPWSALGCSDPNDENSVCNAGDNVGNTNAGFCFQSHSAPGGGIMEAGNPTLTPCVCDMPTPLVGNFASVGTWTTILGSSAAEPGWAVQIYDCEMADVGALTRATIQFVGQTECGQASFIYDSGPINSPINDNSCNAAIASLFVVPPSEPGGAYSVTSSLQSVQWSSNPPGYSSTQLSNQILAGSADFPTQSMEYILTVTEVINIPGNPTCQTSSSEHFVTMPADASISPVNPLCTNSAPAQLQSANGGGTWSTNAQPGSIQDGYFHPEVAGPGNHSVTYTITGACEDQDQININVFDNIVISNFSDYVCSGDNTQYFVSFNVNYSLGGPAPFYVDLGTGSILYNGTYAGTFLSTSVYNITVTDINGCNQYFLNGQRNCDCTTSAGTMSSLELITLCADQCTDMVEHMENETPDANDVFEFIIHDGSYPAVVLNSNSTPTFCFNDIPNGQFGTTYYISAICGDNLNGHADPNDPCYSQSIGTPVIWFDNPIAHISTNDLSVCGLNVSLEASDPGVGMTGNWTANQSFVATGGTSNSSPNIELVVNTSGVVVFTWTITNGVCSGSDQVSVTFVETPNAYAGENFSVCGTVATLNAEFSLSGSTGQWTGPGSFTNSADPNTSVTSNFGSQVFTWREYQGVCYDDDYVVVNFIQEPNPTTISNNDTVCATTYQLNVYGSNFPGSWTAYVGNPPVLMSPAPIYQPSINTTNATVTIPNYSELYTDVLFVWTESSQSGSMQCFGETSINVTFAKQPVASVGPVNEAEICADCIELAADTTGSGWATGSWINPKVIGNFIPDADSPETTFCLDPLGSYGDTAHVRVPLLWAMKNYGCTSIDTMWVTFYKQPDANAGLDKAVCGKNTILGAVYNFPENDGYSPSGLWSVHQRPIPSASATIAPHDNDTVNVTVSHVGVWEFIFRENNSNLPGCYSNDTVLIEFVEIPVISAGEDKDICGPCTQLEAIPGGFEGSWLPNGAAFDDFSNPTTNVCVNNYTARTFTWLESNTATLPQFTLSCSAQDDVVITFWRVPTANIMTDEADSTVCGLTFTRLRAENPGAGITGYWFHNNPAAVYLPNEFTWNNATVTVPSYGYHNFYWIEETGPDMVSGFCTDTAGPLRIHFIEGPTANAGGDTLFCGYSGSLSAISSVGTGVWSTPSVANITFGDLNNPNTQVTSSVLNADNPTNPYFLLIWTEDNTNGCTDKDTIKVTFARIPTANMQIIPPKCFGESATIKAVEDTLGQYTWNFYSGVINSSSPPNAQGGVFRNFVSWNDNAESHIVSLITTNSWNCQSPIRVDTVYEPPIPDFDVTLVGDTCLIGKGGIIFGDTLQNNSFFWLNEDVGPPYGSPITAVYNIPEGSYYIRTSYQTLNMTHYSYYLSTFGNANCVDTLLYEIEPIGVIDASFEISADIILEDLTAPEAPVIFLNYSDYDDVRKRCEWHFGDGNVLKNCDDLVEHTYTEAGCFTPFLIVMNRDLPECRDTAFLDACIRIDNQSSLEIPNIFSPNADGVNDYFQVKATTLRTFSGTIVNRWGRTVYKWENWQDLDAGWDGTLDGGTKASPGVYYFIIKAEGLDGQPYEEHGALHLMNE